MKTITRIFYILIAAGIVSAALYWYGSTRAAPAAAGRPGLNEKTGIGQGAGARDRQERNPTTAGGQAENLAGEGSFHFGGAHEFINADVEILVLIRNLVWVTGTIILVLLLQAGWRRLARRKPKARAGSA